MRVVLRVVAISCLVAMVFVGIAARADQDRPTMAIAIASMEETPGSRRMSSAEGARVYVSNDALLRLEDFTDASVTLTEGQIVLNVGLSPAAAERWVAFTRDHVGSRVAFLVDDRLVRVAKIVDPNMGRGFLIAPLDKEYADRLAREINEAARAVTPVEVVPPWSIELERKVQPWCPADCKWIVPFTATYRKGEEVLVFVGVRHAFTPQNATIRAVDWGFSAMIPEVVIIEGPPTEMGENPVPIVEQVRLRGTPDADEFTRAEMGYAASLALARKIPFLGGEPTRAEQVRALERKVFTIEEIAFSYLLGSLSQGLRSGDLAGTSDARLSNEFARWSGAFVEQYKAESISFEDFSARYRSAYGVEVKLDTDPIARIEGEGQPRALQLLRQNDSITRDEHLLATIENQLASRKRVLVVYGGSHWTTLSQALERRLGKPEIRVSHEGHDSQ